MNFGRIWAVFLRYFYMAMKMDQFSDLFYWPAVDILLWGVTSVWIQKSGADVPSIALAIMTGLIFWQVIWRGNYEVGVNILQEFWNRNLMNLFSTPLKIGEWVLGVMLLGIFKICISLTFASFLIYLLYALNVFSIGWAFLPYLGSLMLSGWVVGFLAGGVVIYFGLRFQMLAWMTAYVFAPFCAIFYPVSALPQWGQTIAHAIPMSHIFEGMRHVLREGTLGTSYLLTSYALNVVYLAVSLSFFVLMYEKSRAKGLSRLE